MFLVYRTPLFGHGHTTTEFNQVKCANRSPKNRHNTKEDTEYATPLRTTTPNNKICSRKHSHQRNGRKLYIALCIIRSVIDTRWADRDTHVRYHPLRGTPFHRSTRWPNKRVPTHHTHNIHGARKPLAASDRKSSVSRCAQIRQSTCALLTMCIFMREATRCLCSPTQPDTRHTLRARKMDSMVLVFILCLRLSVLWAVICRIVFS